MDEILIMLILHFCAVAVAIECLHLQSIIRKFQKNPILQFFGKFSGFFIQILSVRAWSHTKDLYGKARKVPRKVQNWIFIKVVNITLQN